MSLTALISSGNFGSMKWPLSSYLCSSASRFVATFKRLAGGFGEDDDDDDNHLILLGPWQERVVCWPKEQDLPRIFFHLFIWVKDATKILRRQSNLLPLPGLVKITTGLLSGVTKVRAVRPNQDQSCNLQSSQVLKEVWEELLGESINNEGPCGFLQIWQQHKPHLSDRSQLCSRRLPTRPSWMATRWSWNTS